ncbi:MAG: hypothetical protein WCM93_13635, partial [Bacteroidota bacterium]
MLHITTSGYIQQQIATSMSSNMSIDKTCEFCHQPFVAHKTTTQFCSLNCGRRANKRRMRDEKISKVIEAENNKRPFNPVVKEKEFLSVNETCMLLGASR